MNKREVEEIMPKSSTSFKNESAGSLVEQLKSQYLFKSLTKTNKRMELKRSDSGLSSDSSDPGLQGQSSSLFDEQQRQKLKQQGVYESCHDSCDELKTIANISSLTTIKQNPKSTSVKTPFDSNTMSSHEEFFTMSLPSNGKQECHSNDQCHCLSSLISESYDGFCAIKYENRNFEEETSYQNDEYELKVTDLKRQIELISRKVLYMEEHIIDLNTENHNLKKQLSNIEELYKKKIQLREGEIESLKKTILELEKVNSDLRSKEQELSMQKRMLIEDVKLLKQQVTSQETELNILKNSSEKLSELESAYKNANEQLEALKISNCTTLNELEENYKLRFTEKEFEIGILKVKIEELNQQIINLQNNSHFSYLLPSPPPPPHHYHQRTIVGQNKIINSAGNDDICSNISDPSQLSSIPSLSVENKAGILVTESTNNNNDNKSSIGNCLIDAPTSVTETNDQQSLVSFKSSNLENFVEVKSKKMNETTKISTMRKRSLKRISSCDIDEDLFDSLETYNDKLTSQPDVHLTNCVDLITMTISDNNNNSIKSELDNIYQQNENRTEVFPSLPDVMLRKLCLLRENTCSIESLSEQEIDAKFHTLSLAFKTDKFTLEQRVQLYRHQRDVAENDAKTELCHLSEYVQELYRFLLGFDSKYFYNTNLNQLKELKDMLDKINMQVQVIKASVMKISSRSELYGSVKQEEKLSTAFDVILLHTENLKRAKERDAKELEDMKRLLATSGIKNEQNSSDFDITSLYKSRNRRSKNKDNSRLSPILMANHLQNIQVSYQQTSRSPSQNYLRTRRLSVPAAEIRNRPKLLQLLNETSAKRLSEQMKGKDEETDEEEEEEQDEETHSEDKKTVPNNYSDEPKSNEKLSITPISVMEKYEEIDQTHDNFQDEEQMNLNSLSEISSIKENKIIKANKFYKELIQRLAPFEDKNWKQRINEKFRKLYQTIWMLLMAISSKVIINSSNKNNNRYKIYLRKNTNSSYEKIRYCISGALVSISIIILIWSIILPMFYK